ncbi:MAG TPA: trypsin-like peptidase domain-containing protein [Chthonomonadaceae bacterium]|nr:trypsin-like peptidase domain-containing protein [Chthonomonadaceae bacterium]
MVGSGFRSGAAALMLLGLAALPAWAQGSYLEQAEQELAGIVKNTRGGIVSIEDAKGLLAAGPGRAGYREAFQEVYHKAGDIFVKREELDAQIAEMSHSLRANNPKLVEAQANRASLQAQLESLLKQSESKTDTRAVLERVENNYLKALQEKRKQQEADLAQLKQSNIGKSPKYVAAQQALDYTNTRIATLQTELDAIHHDQQLHFFQIHQDTPKSGSGFCLGEGYIVTTADVLEGMQEPIVITDGGLRIKARIVGMDGEANIGLLQLRSKTDLQALRVGDSDYVVPGHFAISIGNQAGQPNSVALNMVAGVRSDGMYSGAHFYPSLIQIAGTIGVGSSGAPVLNARGEVIGVIAAIPVGDWSEMALRPRGPGGTFAGVPAFPGPGQGAVSPSPGSKEGTHSGFQPPPQGFFRPPVTSAGFAIPINAMLPVIADLRAGRPISHSWAGLNVESNQTWVEEDNIILPKRTVFVSALYPDSPAVQAGLHLGDVILQINGAPINRNTDVRLALLHAKPGDVLTVLIARPIKDKPTENKTLSLKVAERPATFDKPVIRAPAPSPDVVYKKQP